MPEPAEHSTCTTVRTCTSAATHEVTATGRLRGLPLSASVDPVDLLACPEHLFLATDRIRNRAISHIIELPPAQPTLFDNEE
jgi:hypothetical protein